MKKNSIIKKFVLLTLLVGLFGGGIYGYNLVTRLNQEIQAKFNGQRWSLPAVVYARPLELYTGLQLTPKLLEKELQLAGFREENPIQATGGYFRRGEELHLKTRGFTFPSGPEQPAKLIISFRRGKISRIISASTGEDVPFTRLAPSRIGSFHPLEHEDRLVLQPAEIPELLTRSLMAVEDKHFYSHYGVSPTGIIRAMLANLKSGRFVQGGSTLTQQLVKNFFLTRDRTLSRKIQEAIMALLLEYNYSKEEILTAYINEVFLGQDGGRAVHGFGLASQFFFRRNVADLSPAQIATLVGMVKGPSYYDPRRNPENCLQRRHVVLRMMLAEDIINAAEYAVNTKTPLTDVTTQRNGFNRFPAFLDLVRRQLKTEYREDDLRSNGLKIITTLDPQVQWKIEEQLESSITVLKAKSGQKNLEAAVVVTGRENGEVLGISGGTNSHTSSFNRALDAHRPIGSLIKPAIYLAALTRGYTLASPVMDTSIQLENDGKMWQPENYDKVEHGTIPLYRALTKSFNLAAVRVGLEIGLDTIISTMRHLGYAKQLTPYPSLLLGSVDMTPLEVGQMYQTIASGGFYQPLRSIVSVMNSDNQLLSRYGLEVEQRFSPEHVYLLHHALQRVMSEGTGSRHPFSKNNTYAGKTGTSNDYRDSWFAGYSTNHTSVVWLGNDDNSPTALSGSTGALTVWGAIMGEIDHDTEQLEQPEPANITWARIDPETLRPTTALSHNSTLLPFISGTEPVISTGIQGIRIPDIEEKAKQLLDSINSIFR
ncbi:penicillin-binding protein 1B [Desulfosediminicola flagellatus]|uniref:penicillin-binding protein 1B n=1 Tax=Desulfosediminicola flagellatus TaxID=2569541 RepID=UPI0010AD5D7A|nr:penicillin-binding protein 1B [Desulfosediminicola flagellatus]